MASGYMEVFKKSGVACFSQALYFYCTVEVSEGSTLKNYILWETVKWYGCYYCLHMLNWIEGTKVFASVVCESYCYRSVFMNEVMASETNFLEETSSRVQS